MNTIQLMWSRFEQCLGTFTMLLVEGSSETGLFRRLSDYVFGIRNFESTKSMRVNLYSKILKFNVDFKNSAKNWEKLFCFSDNCIWIGNIKLFPLRTPHYSSVANMLTSSPKIWDVNKRDFFEHYSLPVINQDDTSDVMWIWKLLQHFYHVASRRVIWNGTF